MDDLSMSSNDEKKLFFLSIESKIEENKKKLLKEPGNILILKELAQLSANIGMNDLSVYFSFKALNYEPDSLACALDCIQYLFLKGQELEANDLIKRILKEKSFLDKKNISSEEIIKLIKIISKFRGDKETAIKIVEKAIKKFPLDKDMMILDAYVKEWFLGNIKESRNILSRTIKKFPMDLSILDPWINLYIKTNAKKTLKLCGIFNKKYSEFKEQILKKEFFVYSSIGDKKKAEKCLDEFNNKIQLMFNKINIFSGYIKELDINELLIQFEKHILYVESFKLIQFNHPLALLAFVISRKYKSLKNTERKNYFLDYAHTSIYKFNYYSEKNSFAVKSEMPDTLFKMSQIAERKIEKISYKKESLSPIFVIGLPRSGSTLIEKLISNKKEILTFGECQIVKKQLYNLTARNTSPSLIDLYKDQFKLLTNKKRFVDKTLNNFPFISLILKSFPDAKFINCIRDSKENALAIYNVLFDTLPWTHTFENILLYMDKYYKMMNKFNKKFPSHVYNIYHQDLVSNTKQEVLKLFNFLNIKYDSDILKNNNDSSQVCTASNWQVRQKISKKFLNKYSDDYYLLDKYHQKYKWLR